MLEVFGAVVFHISMVNWSWGGRCILSTYAFWYILNLFGVMVLHRSTVNWTRGGTCILIICAFCSMWNLFCVTVLHRCIVNWSWGVDVSQYMCIVLCVLLIWCNGIAEIYCQLGWGEVDVFSVYVHSAFMWNLFGVMVFHRLSCQL